MGIRRYVYLGPYVEATPRNETHEVEAVGCTNPNCIGFDKRHPFSPPAGKFCPECASPIGKRKRIEKYRLSTYDVLDGDENIMELFCDEKDGKVRLGSNIRGPRKFDHQSDGELVEDLTTLDRAAEILWFETEFAADIEKIRAACDDVTVKWGLILYYM